jgi:flagellar biosynthetic protein FliR
MTLMIEKLLGFTMVLTRISAFFLVVPIFGWKSIPARIKVAMTLLVTIFFSIIIPFRIDAGKVSALEAILLLANEATYGLALGLIGAVLFATIKFSGRFIERQMGMALAQVMDPLTGERAQPLSSLFEMIFIIIFLSANGHHMFLFIISRSYEAFPAGSIPTMAVLSEGVIKAGSAMFIAGLKIAAPMLAAFILLLIVLAVLARVVPEMNILFISLPMRIGMGLLMTVIFLPFISSFVAEFADLMSKILPI